jgi:hypothetical protein
VELTRLAVRSWCRLRPERLRPALALLDEPSTLRATERPRRHHRID